MIRLLPVLCLVTTALIVPATGRAEITILDVPTGIPEGGSLATLYCRGLTGITGTVEGAGTPLPTTLAGVRISFGEVDAPLLAIVNTGEGATALQQINFQVPLGYTAAPKLIQGTNSVDLPKTNASWGLFFRNEFGWLAAYHASDMRPVTQSDPAGAGEWITALGTNFGEVGENVPSGYPAPLDHLIRLTTANVATYVFRVSLDNADTQTKLESNFMGLAPGRVGVYQINFRMPNPLPQGPAWIYLERLTTCTPFAGPGGACAQQDPPTREATSWMRIY